MQNYTGRLVLFKLNCAAMVLVVGAGTFATPLNGNVKSLYITYELMLHVQHILFPLKKKVFFFSCNIVQHLYSLDVCMTEQKLLHYAQ